MDKTLEIAVTAMILLAAAAILLISYNGQITSFNSDTDNLEQQGCEYQRQRADDPSELSVGCQEETSSDSADNSEAG